MTNVVVCGDKRERIVASLPMIHHPRGDADRRDCQFGIAYLEDECLRHCVQNNAHSNDQCIYEFRNNRTSKHRDCFPGEVSGCRI